MVKVDSHSWLIPPDIYSTLDSEFHFDFDPCPYVPNKEDVIDGIDLEWGKVNWVNPPFRKDDAVNGHGPTAFVRKAIEEKKNGKTSVLILPVQSYVNMLLLENAELRPVGRVAWLNGKDPSVRFAPSTNALFILRPEEVF
jgi:hypothetical protein